jgi:hypothetical protein
MITATGSLVHHPLERYSFQISDNHPRPELLSGNLS